MATYRILRGSHTEEVHERNEDGDVARVSSVTIEAGTANDTITTDKDLLALNHPSGASPKFEKLSSDE